MSLTMNMVGGGGSGIPGNRAVLVARIPSGSTVTATKGGVTLTPMMWVSETYPDQDIALFVFTPAQFDSVNPWTITATERPPGTGTASTTILITSNKEYEVELSFAFYLVKAGVASVTLTPTAGTLTQSDNQLVWDTGAVSLLKAVADLTGFDRMIAVLEAGTSWRGGQTPGLGYSASNPSINSNNGVVTPYTNVTLLNTASGAISAGQYEVDISSETGEQYVWFSASYTGYSDHAIIRIVDWYLV